MTYELEKDYLLCEHGIILLVDEINGDSLKALAEKLIYGREHYQDAPLKLYCRCDGGMTREAWALVNLIRQDGNIEGHMVGDVVSAGAVIWAACQKRYVYPDVLMGLHSIGWWGLEGRIDRQRVASLEADSDLQNARTLRLFAEHSERDEAWWKERFTTHLVFMTAEELIEVGMAEAVPEQPVITMPDTPEEIRRMAAALANVKIHPWIPIPVPAENPPGYIQS